MDVKHPTWRVAFSKLRMFNDCRLKFRFAVIDGLEKSYPPSGPDLTMGSNVHDALKNFFQLAPENRTERRLLEELQRWFRWNHQGYTDKTHMQQYWVRARDALKAFASREDLQATPILVEEFLEMKAADFTLSGRVDRVDRDPDGLFHVIDYKMGKQSPDNFQLQVYAALTAHRLNVDTIRVSYLYLERDANHWVTEVADSDFASAGLLEAEKVVQEIRSESLFTPSPGPFCQGCQFLPICEFGKAYVESRPSLDDLPLE